MTGESVNSGARARVSRTPGESVGGVGHADTRQETRSNRVSDPFIRAENEDDDGYDPYSDRRPEPEPLFERDPWD